MSRRVKVFFELILYRDGGLNPPTISVMERIMTIDVPRMGDFVVVTTENDILEVQSVTHRDEHYPRVRLSTIEFGRQPDKDLYMKDQQYEEQKYAEAIRDLVKYDWELKQ